MTKRYLKLSDKKLGRLLVIDELFDYILYRELEKRARDDMKQTLHVLGAIEKKHYEFWKLFFKSDIDALTIGKRIKVSVLLFLVRIFGESGMYLIMEANERFAIQKYFAIWERYKDSDAAHSIKEILTDEFKNQDNIVGGSIERRINGEKVRNIFLGFNDGLVELLGAVAGFYAAFQDLKTVIIAGLTVAIAGAISMAAGVFVSESSDKEITNVEYAKKRFLGEHTHEDKSEKPLTLAIIVGISYIIGAFIPLLPTLFGSTSIIYSFISSAVMIVIVSYILSYLSGMEIKRRIIMNLTIILAAVIVTSIIGSVIKNVFGISV